MKVLALIGAVAVGLIVGARCWWDGRGIVLPWLLCGCWIRSC